MCGVGVRGISEVLEESPLSSFANEITYSKLGAFMVVCSQRKKKTQNWTSSSKLEKAGSKITHNPSLNPTRVRSFRF